MKIYLVSLILIPVLISGNCVSSVGLPSSVYRRTLSSLKGQSYLYTIDSVRFDGSNEQVGQQNWAYLSKNRRVLQVFQDFGSFKGLMPGKAEQTEILLQKYFPHLIEEINSISKSAEIDRKILLSAAGARFRIGGCSNFVRGKPYPILAGNYDWAPTLSENLVAANGASSDRFASIGMSEAIFGRLSGINSAGVAIAMSAINSEHHYGEVKGLSMPVIVRGILDKADSTKEALRLLKEIPHSTPFNYTVVDSKGNFAVVEATPLSVKVIDNSSNPKFLSATNHFVLHSNETHSVRVYENSFHRKAKLEQISLSGKDKNLEILFDFFGDDKNGLAMKNYSGLFGTLWTVVYEPEKRLMHLRAGTNGERDDFSIEGKKPILLHATLDDQPTELKLYTGVKK